MFSEIWIMSTYLFVEWILEPWGAIKYDQLVTSEVADSWEWLWMVIIVETYIYDRVSIEIVTDQMPSQFFVNMIQHGICLVRSCVYTGLALKGYNV